MDILEIIEKKKNKEEISYDELKFVVEKYISKEIKDSKITSLLLEMVRNGITEKETMDLTKIMIDSEDTLDLSEIEGIVVDKHSIGAGGDKTNIIVSSIVAACGLKVATTANKEIGYTGGIIDKLESIADYQAELSKEDFIKQVNEIGVAITKKSGKINKKLYELRNLINTTVSIPLIASSIMSKEIASGASVVALDIKVGNGSIIKTIDDGRTLANLMIKIGESHNRKVICILSNMDQPLGYSIGNGLELMECIDCLKVKGPKDLITLSIALAANIISVSKNIKIEEAKTEVINSLKSGSAYEVFNNWIKTQNGNIENIDISERGISIKSKENGFVQSIDTLKIQELVRLLGAGREKKTDVIDYGVGIVLSKKVGDFVLENEEIAKVYIENKDIKVDEILKCFNIGEHAVNTRVIYEIIK